MSPPWFPELRSRDWGGFTRLTGFTAEDIAGNESIHIDIWAEPADRDRLVEGLESKGEVFGVEALFRIKDGSTVTGLLSARLIDFNGEPCILSITRDISQSLGTVPYNPHIIPT